MALATSWSRHVRAWCFVCCCSYSQEIEPSCHESGDWVLVCFQRVPMSNATRPSTMLLVAALLLAVGIGNLWIGQVKSTYYAQSLREASAPTKHHPHGRHAPDYIKSLRSRAHYYDIVRGGGLVMLLCSVALALIHVVRTRTRGPSLPR